MTSTVWITGVLGFTARHFVHYLNSLADSHRLIGLDISHGDIEGLDEFHQVDLSNVQYIEQLAKQTRPSTVIHLAGIMHSDEECDMWRVNVGGTTSLLTGLAAAGLTDLTVLGIGSAAEYLPTINGALKEDGLCGGKTSYGRTKWAQTLLTLGFGTQLPIRVLIARPFNLIGPGLSTNLVAGSLCAQFSRTNKTEIMVGNVRAERDFIDVRDAVRGYWQILQNGISGEVYNICTGIPTSIDELLEIFSDLTGGIHSVTIDPARIKQVDIDRAYGSYEKLYRTTHWLPKISLRESIHDMLAEARA